MRRSIIVKSLQIHVAAMPAQVKVRQISVAKDPIQIKSVGWALNENCNAETVWKRLRVIDHEENQPVGPRKLPVIV